MCGTGAAARNKLEAGAILTVCICDGFRKEGMYVVDCFLCSEAWIGLSSVDLNAVSQTAAAGYTDNGLGFGQAKVSGGHNQLTQSDLARGFGLNKVVTTVGKALLLLALFSLYGRAEGREE